MVVSLFVNPTQFGDGEDLDAYPRDEERDAELAAREGVDLLWIPDARADVPGGLRHHGRGRPATSPTCSRAIPEQRGSSHFRGVTTVVAKLFNSVQPDVAYFGRKDAQQAVVIRRMVRDLDFPVRIEVLPTVREEDGLALSSRNAYLDPRAARARRRDLARAARRRAGGAASGETSTGALVELRAERARSAGIEPEYVEAR